MALTNPWDNIPQIPNQIPNFAQFQAQQRPVGAGFGAGPLYKNDPASGQTAGIAPPAGFGTGLGSNPAGFEYQKASSPVPPASGNPATNPATPGVTSKPSVTGQGDPSAWDANDMGDLGGAQYDPQRGWVPTGQALPKGYQLGHTGAYLPVAYNAVNDVDRHEYAGKNAEPSWRRVNRWAGDFQRQGYDAQTAYNMALSRLKNDYEATGMDWHRSGFDLTSVQASPGGAAYAKGGSPAPGSAGVPAPSAVGEPASGGTPGGGGVPGAINGGGGALTDAQHNYLVDDPDYALRYLLKQRGIDTDQKGLVGSYMKSKYLNPLKAAIAATGIGTGGSQLGDIESVLARFGAGIQGKGNDLETFLHGIAQQAHNNPALGDLSDQDMMALEENLGALGSYGSNAYIESARKNQFDDVKQGFGDLFFGGLAGGDMPSFQEFMRTRGFRPY